MIFLPNYIDSYLCYVGTLYSKIGFSGWKLIEKIGYYLPSAAATEATPFES